MPIDVNGIEIKVGDVIAYEYRVVSIIEDGQVAVVDLNLGDVNESDWRILKDANRAKIVRTNKVSQNDEDGYPGWGPHVH